MRDLIDEQYQYGGTLNGTPNPCRVASQTQENEGNLARQKMRPNVESVSRRVLRVEPCLIDATKPLIGRKIEYMGDVHRFVHRRREQTDPGLRTHLQREAHCHKEGILSPGGSLRNNREASLSRIIRGVQIVPSKKPETLVLLPMS